MHDGISLCNVALTGATSFLCRNFHACFIAHGNNKLPAQFSLQKQQQKTASFFIHNFFMLYIYDSLINDSHAKTFHSFYCLFYVHLLCL